VSSTGTVRWGIVGPGRIARNVVRDFAEVAGAEAVAVASRSLDRAQAFAEEHQIPAAYGSYGEIIATDDVDVLYIATPHPQHHALALAAIEAGKAVLVEKTFTATVAGAEEVVAAARRHSVFAMEAMWTRFQPAIVAARTLIEDGAIGEVRQVQADLGVDQPLNPDDRLFDPAQGGGAMLDLGLSILDLGFWLGGSPAPLRVSACLDESGKERTVEQSGSAFVVCETGVSIFADVTWHHLGEGERFGVGVRGSRGSGAINPLTVWKELHGVPMDVSPSGSGSRENAFTASYRAEWAHFEAAIAGEAKVPSLQEHLTLHRVVDAIYRSAQDGRDVVL
jgi:predicted dehydrogenase